MFRILLICILILGVLGFAPYLAHNQGLVVIYFAGTEVSLSLFVAVFALIVFLATLYIAEAFVKGLVKLLFGWILNFKERRQAKSQAQAQEALLKLVEGDYTKAERLLNKSIKYAKNPLVNLVQTFEVALVNGHLNLAEKNLKEAMVLADYDDQNLINVCKLKYYVATKQEAKAIDLLKDLLYRVNSKEVNLLAQEVYRATKSYTQLLDLTPSLVKRGYISQEQAVANYQWVHEGYINQQIDKGSVESMLEWWKNQPSSHTNNIIARNALLAKLLELHYTLEAASVVYYSFRNCKVSDLETSNFIDLLAKFQVDTPDGLISSSIAKYLSKFSPLKQVALAQILVKLYFNQADFNQARLWSEKLIDLENKNHLPHTAENIIIAQVLYRKLEQKDKLIGLNSLVDNTYNQQLAQVEAELAAEQERRQQEQAKRQELEAQLARHAEEAKLAADAAAQAKLKAEQEAQALEKAHAEQLAKEAEIKAALKKATGQAE